MPIPVPQGVKVSIEKDMVTVSALPIARCIVPCTD